MKQNKYDDEIFFEKYSHMDRSVKGLSGAEEWETLKRMLPDFRGKHVLDLGCGFGWHCQYAMENGTASAVGVDISERMLEEARKKNQYSQVEYQRCAMEDIEFEEESFDCVISSLAFHYLESSSDIAEKIYRYLAPGDDFVFSAEHPVFTAYGTQDWIYDEDGKIAHFPVDNYFIKGKRDAVFLGESMVKYHKTLTTYLNTLLKLGFIITGIEEPQPAGWMIKRIPGMADELRRPMMLIVSARKGK